MQTSSVSTSHRPAILAEWGLHTDWIAKPLLAAGFEVACCSADEIPAQLASGRFNVLIMGRYAFWRKTRQAELATVRNIRDAVQEFLSRGGGVFLAGPGIGVIPVAEILDPLGITLLKLGVEQDADIATAERWTFASTTRISGPVASGVQRIWYPVDLGHATALWPLRVSDDWQVVVETGRGSRSKCLTQDGYGLAPHDAQGDLYSDSVPIMAVREGLPGRIAVCGIPACFFIYAPHNFPTAKLLLEDGFGQERSDLLALVTNTLSWLAAPSAQAGSLGGATTDPLVLQPQIPGFPEAPPVSWPVRTFPPDAVPLRGVIGARTALSTGSGTVADYVSRARQTGLDFIVFLEDFKALNQAGLQQLKDECEAQTTDSFFAVPGYTIEDCVGSHCFVYGYAVELPLPDILSEDGAILATRRENIGRDAGRVEHLHCNLIFGELGMRCRKGFYRHTETPKWLNGNRFNDSIALVTWDNGRVIEDVREQYRSLMDKGLRLNPVVLTFMSAPDHLDAVLASGWRTTILEPYAGIPDKVLRKHMAPELEWWGKLDEEHTRQPRYRFDNWQYGTPFQSLTNGPLVHAWTVSVSERDPEWRMTDADIPPTADWFRVDVVAFRLRIGVQSDAGLAEVILFDGVDRIRCWRPNGATEFTHELDLVHHQQMHLMLEARDVNGAVAMTSDFLTYRRDWCEFYCADRNNPLTIGYERDNNGYAFGWSGTEHLSYNNGTWGGNSPWVGRWWYSGDDIRPVPKDPVNDLTIPTDGGIRPAGAGLHLQLNMPALDPPEFRLMVNPLQEMISTDAAVCGFVCDHGYDLEQPYFVRGNDTGFGLFGAYPTRYVSLTRRAITFRPKPHALTALVTQHDLRWKRDPELTAPLPVGWLDDGPNHVFHAADGSVRPLAELKDGATLRWRRDEALVSWTQGARPAIFINDGVDLQLGNAGGNSGRLIVYLPTDAMPTRHLSATVRILAAGGTVNHTSATVLADIRKCMGFTGCAYTVAVDRGTIRSQRFILAMHSEDASGVAFEIPQAALPMALPLTVSGLNANWSTILYDRNRRKWRPVGTLDGTGYATLDTEPGDSSVYIGPAATASHAQLVLSFVQTGADEFRLEVHNPTAVAIAAHVRPSPYVDLVDDTGHDVRLKPGASTVLALTAAVPASAESISRRSAS